jgi:predicted  nucleic acid-binding Zn-ribbon protein
MKEQLEILIQLQAIETQINRLRSMLGEAPQKIEHIDQTVEELEKSATAEELLLSDLKKKYRSSEREVQALAAQEKRSEDRLRSVKTNKEYQSILKEIADLKQKTSEIEDEMIGYLEEIDRAEKAFSEKKQELEILKQRMHAEKQTIQEESENWQERLEELEKQWEALSSKAEPDLLEKYLHIRKLSGGMAIARVKNAVCEACHLNIPPQLYNELQRSDRLIFCPYCQRIIYWKETKSIVS